VDEKRNPGWRARTPSDACAQEFPALRRTSRRPARRRGGAPRLVHPGTARTASGPAGAGRCRQGGHRGRASGPGRTRDL